MIDLSDFVLEFSGIQVLFLNEIICFESLLIIAMVNMCSALKVINLSYTYGTYGTYGENPVFSGISFELTAGEAIQVVGENGQGKTTLLRILAGLLPTSEGQVFWEGLCIQKFPETYRTDLIYVGHLLALKPYLTAKENLALSARLRGYEVEEPVLLSLLKQVGLENQFDQMTYQLSAGQRQRLALARLLAAPSRLWILDEPFSVLCQQGQHLIGGLIEEYLLAGGRVVFTSHHPVHLKKGSVRVFAL